MNVVVYLPKRFYASVASCVSEMLLAVNAVQRRETFRLRFVSGQRRAITRAGIEFPVEPLGRAKIDVLLVLAGHSIDLRNLETELADEIDHVQPIVRRAVKDAALIAGTCSASLLMAKAGLLRGKRATIAWWAKSEAARLFPDVRWDPSRIVIKQGRLYTSGGVYSALDLVHAILVDLGFAADARLVRKILVTPPSRELQSPYETDLKLTVPSELEAALERALRSIGLGDLAVATLAKQLGWSGKTLTRRLQRELGTTPGKWIQERRLSRARELLESTTHTIYEICDQIGYRDQASFGRLFSRVTGLTPIEFRTQMRL